MSSGSRLVEIISAAEASSQRRSRQLWLEPLPPACGIDITAGGLDLADVPIGVADWPEVPRVAEFALNLGSTNLLVVGSPGSGKTHLMSSIALRLSARHAPSVASLMIFAYGGAELSALDRLPHLAGIFGLDSDPGLAQRALESIRNIIELRARKYRAAGVATFSDWNRRAQVHGQYDPHIFVMVDGYALASEAVGSLASLDRIVRSGKAYGVTTIVACQRAFELPFGLRGAFDSTIEFELATPSDSIHDRGAVSALGVGHAGRAISPDGHVIQVALPVPPDVQSGLEPDFDLSAHSEVRAIGSPDSGLLSVSLEWVLGKWRDEEPTPRYHSLPSMVDAEDLPAPDPCWAQIGIQERGLEPVGIYFGVRSPHLLVVGDRQSGKSSALRTTMQQLSESMPTAKFVVFDPRGDLRLTLTQERYADLTHESGRLVCDGSRPYSATDGMFIVQSLASMIDSAIQDGDSVRTGPMPLVVVIDDLHLALPRWPDLEKLLSLRADAAAAASVHFVVSLLPGSSKYDPESKLGLQLVRSGAHLVCMSLGAPAAAVFDVPAGLTEQGRARLFNDTARGLAIQIAWSSPLRHDEEGSPDVLLSTLKVERP